MRALNSLWRAKPMGCSRPFSAMSVVHAKNKYTNTILLPKTQFPLRADAAKREHLFRDRCTTELYPWQLKNNPKEMFILHDGPPFANGSVHSGHAMNKILKDIVNRHKVLQGHKVWYRPGWDCHGLPIELKALEAIRQKADTVLSPVEIRKIARNKALSEIEVQRNAFKSWGVMGDWDKPYLTLDRDYEVRQLRVFHEMVKKGYIYRQLKPVYWSPSSKSALAESELEYKDDHLSTSIFVRFPIENLSPTLQQKWGNLLRGSLYALIWTTTPWTIPSNKAIAINPSLSYSLVHIHDADRAGTYIIATDRLAALKQETDIQSPPEILDCVNGASLLGTEYKHPLTKNIHSVIHGDHVTSESGTGLVHTAPGHGMEDYDVCLKLGIEPFSPVDGNGRFTKEAGPDLEGKFVLDQERAYYHKYPYDWRTKKPVILRATAQWFANVENLQKDAVKALQSVRMVPEVSAHRLEQFTLSRKEWCISRQRSWGVPIPALYDTETGEPLLTETSVKHIISVFEQQGTDAWWEEQDDAIFVAPAYKDTGRTYRRGYDTMDVWFDSGTSWTMINDVPERKGSGQCANMYLEGSDQHRGWFQSSLLTSIALTGKPPYETLITHGFALDEMGRKMSKSIGNTIEPKLFTDGGENKQLNPAYGSDVLRLWVASCEYTRDVTIGPTVMAQVSSSIRKIRTTARFLLGNLNDFSHKERVPYEQLCEMDRFMLHELHLFGKQVSEAYDQFGFNRAVHLIQNFTTNQLSAFYFDIIKDRLYNEESTSRSRRMAQTVLYQVLEVYTTALAPITCHMAEEIYEHFRPITRYSSPSIFQNGWLSLEDQWHQDALAQKWALLKELKSEVNQILEQARQEKVLNASQEADVDLAVDSASTLGKVIHAMTGSELAALFLTAHVRVHETGSPVESRFERPVYIGDDITKCNIMVSRSTHAKCPRCWNYTATEADSLCARCANVIS